MIIDCHLHLPKRTKGQRFVDSKQVLLEDLTRHTIDYGILIPDNVPKSDIGDLDTVLELTENDPRLFLMGTLDVIREDNTILQQLNALFQTERIVGIKIFPGHDPIYPTDEKFKPVYVLCIKYDRPIMIHTGWNLNDPTAAQYNDPKHIVKIAQRFPQLKIVIAHFFWPNVEYCYEVTRPFHNIYFDTSALADEVVIKQTGSAKIVKVLTKTILERPEHVLFGTDYAMCDIPRHIDLIKSLPIDQTYRDNVFYRNTMKLFNLKIM